MSVTAQQVFNIAMALIDEMQDDGTINANETASYAAKTPSILNMLQAELMPAGDLYNVHEISNYPIPNQLGDQWDIREYKGSEDLTFEAVGSRAYYIEVDAPCTIYLEEEINGSWNELLSITVPNTVTKFTAYKGSIMPSSTLNKVRIRVTGLYYARTKNRALFDIPFASGREPDYRPWIKKEMPSDFHSINQITEESCDRYSKDATYKWEGKKDLYVSYNFDGNIRIVYRAIPSLITSLSSLLQIDDLTAIKVLPYGLASHLVLSESEDAAEFFQERYEELKGESYREQPAAEEEIEDVYNNLSGMR